MAEPDPESIFEPDDAEDARLDAEAMKAYHERRLVPHAKVAERLASCGTSDLLPPS